MRKTKSDLENELIEKSEEIKHLSTTIEDLKYQIKLYEEDIDKYEKEEEEVQKLKNEYKSKLSELYWAPTKNERNAGRKSIITDDLINQVISLSNDGTIQKLISERLNISVGTVNKIINQHNNVKSMK